MARHNHGSAHGHLEEWTYKTWQKLRDKCCCSMVPAEVVRRLYPTPFTCHRSRTNHRASRRTRKIRLLHNPRKQNRKNDDAKEEEYSVMAASSQRGHPGGDQGPFQFKRRRCRIHVEQAHHVCLGTAEVSVLEEAVEVVQHWREVRSGVIFWSLSFATGLGSIHTFIQCPNKSLINRRPRELRCKCENILNFVNF